MSVLPVSAEFEHILVSDVRARLGSPSWDDAANAVHATMDAVQQRLAEKVICPCQSFLDHIRAGLPDGSDVERSTNAVMASLAATLTDAEADEIVPMLPARLRAYWPMEYWGL